MTASFENRVSHQLEIYSTKDIYIKHSPRCMKMAASADVVLPTLKSLPNFRVLCAKYQNCCSSYKGMIYRSSRPDFINENDAMILKRIGINSIVDLRSRKEYSLADGKKLLDRDFQLCQVKPPHQRNYKPLESVRYKVLDTERTNYSQNNHSVCECSGNGQSPIHPDKITKMDVKPNVFGCDADDSDSTSKFCQHSNTLPVFKSHYLVNFFSGRYVWTVFNRAPWYMKLISLLFLLLDVILNTGYKYFIRFFAHHYLNSAGIIGQYKDMINLSQRSICAALKLLTDPVNSPAILNCAHGKDRTGIVSALVLHCLGKSKEFIAKDYAKSGVGLESIQDRVRDDVVVRYDMDEEFALAKEETMLQLLQYIEESYGSIDNYMEYIGFSQSEQERFRKFVGADI